MANSFGSLYIGASGLRNSLNALNTTSNNLANVDTTGYVRQQVRFADESYVTFNTTAAISNQQSGLGVTISDVVHARDIFLDKAYRSESGRQAFYAASFEACDEVYTYFQELEGEAFQDGLEDLWVAFQELAKDPSNSINQNLVIQKASLFLSRTQAVYSGLTSYQSNLNDQISDDIDTINELGNRIYELNLEIQKIEAGGVETAMTLRDERDNCLDQLACYANISYKELADGIVKVTIEGQDFVTEDKCYEMGKMVDKATGFVTPYWPYLSDENNDKYVQVFDLTREVSSENNTDIGELKALLFARGDRIANYTDIEGVDADTYNNTVLGHIATGDSVMLETEAELDQLFHNIITSINDLLCPNITADEAGITTPKTVTYVEDGVQKTMTITEDTLVLDTENCCVGSDGELPPQELYTRIGVERYTTVTDDAGNTYYVYNEEDTSDETKMYTITGVTINENLQKLASLLPHLNQDETDDTEASVSYSLAENLATIWDTQTITLNPNDTGSYTFANYYAAMIGELGTLGSVYDTTATSLSTTVSSVDSQRQQVMGVSSDEELTNMIKYQNAYNANSRFINVINEMIEVLLTQLG